MNRDLARKLIALAISGRKSADSISAQEMVKEIAFKRHLLSTEIVEKLVQECIKDGLLVEEGGKLKPSFTVSGIIVPLDFTVDEDELFSADTSAPLTDRMLEAAVGSGMVTKKEAIKLASEFLKSMKYLDFDIALMSVLLDLGVNVSDFAKEVM